MVDELQTPYSTQMSEDVEQPPPRRGRPSRKEAAGIDRGVLDAARDCFVESGFDGTTMEAIAERAGVTKKTLYLRYPDKGALLKAVLEHRLAAWSLISSQNDWQMGESTESQLRYCARVIVRHSQDPEVRAFVKLVDGSFGWAQSIGQEFQQILRKPMIDFISVIVGASAKHGFSVENPYRAAATFLGMLSAYAYADPLGQELKAEALEAFADYTTEVFLKGRESW